MAGARSVAGGAALFVLLLALTILMAPVGLAADVRVTPSGPITTTTGFVENRGQWPADVRYFGREGSIEATLVDRGVVLRPRLDLDRGEWLPPVTLDFGAAAASLRGEEALATKHHFLRGPSGGTATSVPGFRKVRYEDVGQGAGVVLRRGGGSFAYDVHVPAGNATDSLVLEIRGGRLVESGSPSVLALETPAGRFEQRIERSWQIEPDGSEREIAVRFRVLAVDGDTLRFGFEAPARDLGRPLVIDPSLVFSTYVGGHSQEWLRGMDVDASGATYLTSRPGLGTPTTPGAYQTGITGLVDTWVGKLSADGSVLEWATSLGGTDAEESFGVDVDDHDGTVVVFGATWSPDFPTTAGTVQPQFASLPGKSDLFITRLAPAGDQIVWSTFYGGPGHEFPHSSKIMPNGDVLVHFSPTSAIPPATPTAFDPNWKSNATAVARLTGDGHAIVFQTYLEHAGINEWETDHTGAIYGAGGAGVGAPTTPGAVKPVLLPHDNGVYYGDGYVIKLTASGQLIWGTYLGSQLTDQFTAIAVDSSGAVYVAGGADASDYPLVGPNPPFPWTAGEPVITKLLPNGSGIVWSRFGGACCGGVAGNSGLVVNDAGEAFVVGSTNELFYPVTADAFQKANLGSFPSSDVFLTKFDAAGARMIYSTWFGGTGGENLARMEFDAQQTPRIALVSSSTDAPISNGTYDSTFGGHTDIVVAAFEFPKSPFELLSGGAAGNTQPILVGTGALTALTPGRLELRGGGLNAPAFLLVGTAAWYQPFLGGLLVPVPNLLLPTSTNGSGALDVPFTWPSGVPAGAQVFLQIWVADPGAPEGWSGSNGLKLLAQ